LLRHSHHLQQVHKAIGEFSPHVIRSSSGLTINGGTQYPARFFYANYETFDFVFHSAYLVGIRTPLLIKHGVLLFFISCERGPAFAFPCDSILAIEF
jgi:hypothetical protein